MKELIVIVGTLLLGAIIFNMMIGPGQNSLKTQVKNQMVNSTLTYQEQYI
ncbi:MAG: hypothetical protein MJ146_03265 [Clostridia bacterium]|nr:hypothetical protein [Clostridia bacterium]